MHRTQGNFHGGLLVSLAVSLLTIGWVAMVAAQPDPRQMSGLPLPDGQLPVGTVSVRVIRGQLTNNVTDHPVELHHGDTVAVVNTDADGRARFLTLSPGEDVYAVTELDGHRIESQVFPIPGQGGIRVMLVGAADPSILVPPAETGYVTFGSESWIQVEVGEETVELYYLLDVMNMAQVPVEPEAPIVFDLPSSAQSATVLAGSAPDTRVDGRRVELPGPFQPGSTPLRVGYSLSHSGSSLAISQRFPADLESLLVSVEKWGAMDIASDQISRRGEMSPEESGGATYLLASGPRILTGEALSFELTGLPHHSSVPSTTALALAVAILGLGTWGAVAPVDSTAAERSRRAAEARREKLFIGLVKVERQHGAGKIGSTKYSSRRRELIAALEQVYRELDEAPTAAVLQSARMVPSGSPAPGL